MKTRTIRAFGFGVIALAFTVVALANTFNLFGPVTGVLKGSATSYVTTAAAGSDIRPLLYASSVRSVTAAGAITTTTADVYVCVNKTVGAASAVAIFTSPATGYVLTVLDCKGDGATNNITITPAAGNIDGAGTFVINTNYGAWQGVYTGTIWKTVTSR